MASRYYLLDSGTRRCWRRLSLSLPHSVSLWGLKYSAFSALRDAATAPACMNGPLAIIIPIVAGRTGPFHPMLLVLSQNAAYRH